MQIVDHLTSAGNTYDNGDDLLRPFQYLRHYLTLEIGRKFFNSIFPKVLIFDNRINQRLL